MMSAPAPSAPAVRPPPGMPSTPMYGTAMAPPVNFQQSMAESIDDVGGTRAVEVAAMLGDSVVGVKHCMDPRGGKVTPLTYGMFAIGLATLLAASVAFYLSVDNAAYNQGKFDYETQVQHRPGHAVKKRKLSLGYDWVAFGGLAASLACFTIGLARLRSERRSPFFRIGTAPGVEFSTEGAPGPSFPLVAPHGDDFAFNFAHGMEGEMVVGGQSTSLGELAAQGRTTISPIPANAKIRVRTGKTTFLISAVPQPRRAAAPLFASLESRVAAYFGGSLAAHLIFWFIIDNVPPEGGGVAVTAEDQADTTARSSTTAKEDPTQDQEEDKPEDGEDQSGGTGTAMTLEEGKMGKKESTRLEGQYKMQNNNVDPQLARQQAIENARNAGILGSQALQQTGGAFASLTATGDISSGFDDSNVYGGLLGNEPGEMNGGFGYGRSGFGPGGGGTGWGTIGTGRYGTIGHGSGTGSGYGVGSGRGGMKGRQAAVPTVAIGSPTSTGDLDKAIIRRYIKRNLPKISYCYEKELLARPTLSGVVSTQFMISGNGSVTASSGTGVDPAVASCVASVISSIQFPQPKGGGNVQVNYPFTFRPAGQ
ncbi:MAG: AgmX/PglI C-terminal domain-containing protein [Deltaproteobacteria bacterium]|nr:AgmX/PglI C-terminal domain-containing protein [Deltaproteobacteria bacterium]